MKTFTPIPTVGPTSSLPKHFASTDYAWIDKLTASELPEVRPLAVLGAAGRSMKKLAGGSIRPRQGDLVPFEFAGFANHAANWRTALGLIDARIARLAGKSAAVAPLARPASAPSKSTSAPITPKALSAMERICAAFNLELESARNSKPSTR